MLCEGLGEGRLWEGGTVPGLLEGLMGEDDLLDDGDRILKETRRTAGRSLPDLF